MKKLKIGIIGCGNMGEAILRRLLCMSHGKTALMASDPDASKRNRIYRKYKIRAVNDNLSVAEDSGVIVLAVKPRDIDDVVRAISRSDLKSKLIISIAAGVPTRRLEMDLCPGVAVIRAMPNMPAFVGCGVTAICAGKYAKASHMKTAKAILAAIGDVVALGEEHMDAVTAISGSGPAYFFYLVECMVEAAKELGLGERDATVLAVKTAIGSARILEESLESPQVLRAKVTSKGGTTEAAFRVFESKKFKEIFKEAISAGHRRAKELGNRS